MSRMPSGLDLLVEKARLRIQDATTELGMCGRRRLHVGTKKLKTHGRIACKQRKKEALANQAENGSRPIPIPSDFLNVRIPPSKR